MDADATGPQADLPSSPFADSMDRDVRRDAMMRRLFPEAGAIQQRRVGRFALLRMLGQGGMGRVYAAYDEQLDRRVAVKVLRYEPDARSRTRSLREAQSMAKIDHPNVVGVFEVGEYDEQLYIAMEYVEGDALDRWQADDRGWAEVLDVYLQAGEGLAAAHAAGLVHRDFKPHNVMISQAADGRRRARVLDFGLARAAGEDAVITQAPPPEADPRLTTTGDLLGTPVYMPLEQLQGHAVGPKADQFAFCVSLWEGLFGARPFDESSMDAMLRSRTDGPGPIERTEVPEAVGASLRRGLSTDPGDRFASMRDLLDALQPPRERGRALIIGVPVGGALLLAGVALGQSAIDEPEPCAGAEAALGEAWNARRREDVRQTLRGIEGFGESAWGYAAPRMDAYAAAWLEAHRDTCEQTLSGQQSDSISTARSRCLDAARRELDATTDALAAADASVAARTVALVDGLPDVASCSDLQRLQTDVPAPPPDRLVEVESLEDELAAAQTSFRVGRYDQAHPALSSLAEASAEIGYAPLQARIDLLRGRVLSERGEHDEAARALSSAMQTALSTGQWREAFMSARHMTRLETLLERHDATAAWASTAQGLHARIATPETTQELEQALGWAANGAEKHEVAIEHLSRALDAAQHREDAPLAGAGVLVQLSEVNWQRGEYDLAVEQERQALAAYESELGDQHPSTAYVANSLAIYLGALGQLDEALAMSEPTLAILERASSPTSSRVLGAKKNHLQLLRASGRLEDAEALAREVAEAMRELWGATHTETLLVRTELGLILASQERYDQAVPVLEAAIEGLNAKNPDAGSTLSVRRNYAVILRRMGRPDAARAEYEDLLSRMPAALGPEHPLLRDTRSAYANVLNQLGELEAAAEQYALIVDSAPEGDPQIAITRVGYARLLAKQGEYDAAAEQLEGAWIHYGEGKDDPAEIAKAAYLMALVQVERGDEDAVELWTERAKAAHAKADAGGNQVEALAKLAAKLDPDLGGAE